MSSIGRPVTSISPASKAMTAAFSSSMTWNLTLAMPGGVPPQFGLGSSV